MDILVDNWSSGLWTAGPPGKNPAKTLTRLTNMQVMDEGTVQTRPGCSVYVSLANTVDGAYMSNKHYFKTEDTTVYRSAVSLAFTQAGRRLRIAGLAAYGIAEDLTFFPTVMLKDHNNIITNWGINVVPTTPVATDLAVAGDLTGDYRYRIAFYNSNTGTLGSVSDETTSINVTASQIGLSGIPTTCIDAQANYVFIYRTQGGISGSYFYVDKVALGTATYTDNVADLGLGDEVSYYHIVPPVSNVAGRYKSRLLLFDPVVNPRYGYPSDGSRPESYDAHLYEMIADSGDTIEAITELGDYAFVFGRNAIYQMQVTSGDAIYTSKLPTGRGTINGRTVAIGSTGIYFVSDDGVYNMTGFSPTKVSGLVDSMFRGIDRGGLSTITDQTKVSASFIGGRYYFTYYGVDGIWHTLIYNETAKRWKHFTGWLYTTQPITGTMPLVGLPDTVGMWDWKANQDNTTSFTSVCGFNLPGIPATVLVDFRSYRLSVESTGSVQVDIYDNGVLKWSAAPLVAPTFRDSWKKHNVDLGEYFVEPEIVVSSTAHFTLKAFEASLDPVRKSAYDYTRATATTTTDQSGAAQT